MQHLVRPVWIALFSTITLFAPISFAAESIRQTATEGDVGRYSRDIVLESGAKFDKALAYLQIRNNPDVAAAMILGLRFNQDGGERISEALSALTDHKANGWFEWMLWQQANPQIKPHPSYADIKLEILARIDPEFLRFLGPTAGRPDRMKIRLEEITWGGVQVDGIPSLDNPTLIEAAEADYLLDTDLVFGVEINGDARAYPLRIMGWHEMFNETIGGVPVALAYCTLCGAGILFETKVEGEAKPLVFGSSGFLYRSNKLMFDRRTGSLWNQFTGKPVTGPLANSGIELKVRPVAITSWGDWLAANPDTRVLSIETGFRRDYGSGVVYRDYFASDDLMFPALLEDTSLKQKDYVFGIRSVGAAKAWPVSAFAGGKVINDAVGPQQVVLIGDAASRTVRAYDRGELSFQAGGERQTLQGPGGEWRIEEAALVGPDGARLPRVPGHIAYWFAWDGYLGVESELYAATHK